jgi:hypothetical protein
MNAIAGSSRWAEGSMAARTVLLQINLSEDKCERVAS